MAQDPGGYFVRRRGRVMGPFDLRQLERMLRRGNVNRGDQCSTDRRTWSKLEDLEELFPPAPVVEAVPEETEEVVEITAPDRVGGVAEWFYHHQGQEQGPVTEADILRLISQGVLSSFDSVWRDGMADWQAVGSVFQLPAQPGMVQPGMVQPGMVQPGMVQPGMVQPGMVQPGMVQPGMVQPGMVQPGMVQPGMVQPGMVQPGMVQPGMVQPGMMQPNIHVSVASTPQPVQSEPGGRSEGAGEGAGTGLIACGYIFAFLMPIVGLIIGIVTCSKGSAGHGVAHILLSFAVWFVVFTAIMQSQGFNLGLVVESVASMVV